MAYLLIPIGTIALRIGNDVNNAKPYRFFSYWHGDIAQNYVQFKKTFADRFDPIKNPLMEFYEVTKDLILHNIPHLPTEDFQACAQENELCIQNLCNKIDELIDDTTIEEKTCYKNIVGSNMGTCKFDPSLCTDRLELAKFSNNPDYILSHAFVKMGTGWCRLVDQSHSSPNGIDELMLPNELIAIHMKPISHTTYEQYNDDTFVPHNGINMPCKKL